MSSDLSDSALPDAPKFNLDDSNNIFKEVCEEVLAGQNYHPQQTQEWIKRVSELSLQRLSSLEKPYKYMLSCSIVQKKGSGYHTSNSCFWDQNMDAQCIYRWENKSLMCTISFFACFDSALQ